MKILDFFKRVIGIFGFKNSLERLGIKTVVSEKMHNEIELWRGMYEAKKGLLLPASIASETARLVTLELQTKICGSARADYLNEQYTKVIKQIRTTAEYACAGGGIILKPFVNGKKIETAFVKANNFIPTQFDISGNITGAAFLDKQYRNGKIYTRIEHHEFDGEKYIIKNYAFVSAAEGNIGNKTTLKEVESWKDIEPLVVVAGIERPLFSYFKMPMANTTDADSPLGVSVYAKCTGLINDAEKQYDRLLWEFKSGERALYVDTNAVKRDENGREILPDERLYKLLNADDSLFKDWSPTLREQNIINGLNEILRKIEFNSGLAYGTLSDVQTTDKTAEEIKSSKQRSYAHISDIQQALKNALCDLIKAMNALADLYELAPSGDYEVSFNFDDSIVADRKAEFNEKLQLVSAGIMAPWELRMWYFGEDEETAKQKSEQMSNDDIIEE